MKKILLPLLILAFILVGCGETNANEESDIEEDKNNKLKQSIEKEEYGEALKLVNNKYEKESDILEDFIEALKRKKDGSLVYYDYYLNLIPDDYDGAMSEEIKEEISDKKELFKQKKPKLLKEVIQRIKDGEHNIDLIKMGIPYSIANDKKFKTLKDYSEMLDDKESGYMKGFYLILDDISVDDVKTIDQKFGEKVSKFKKEYGSEVLEAKKEEKERNKPKPSIGMTAEEVKESKWGEPKDINKTTTEQGVSEQWVYNGGRYVYLENGTVTSIQE